MTGPHDHLTEQGRIPDQARPYAADNPHDAQVRPDDLQARLERLPLNHPSSPYRDDGSRKTPPPDLTEYELPLPDDPDSPADPDLPDQPPTAPDGSWDWKGRHLTPHESRTGDEVLAESRAAEGRDSNGRLWRERSHSRLCAGLKLNPDHGHLVQRHREIQFLAIPTGTKEKLADAIARQS